jgi:hypothetical protein
LGISEERVEVVTMVDILTEAALLVTRGLYTTERKAESRRVVSRIQ